MDILFSSKEVHGAGGVKFPMKRNTALHGLGYGTTQH